MMRSLILFVGILIGVPAVCQDIPLFSQKLTNSFFYNPALAGQTTGSATYTYRRNYADIEGGPEDHFLSAHTPFSGYRCGVGLNLFQEKVNVIRNSFATAAFAYHIRNKFKAISVGVSTEFGTSIISEPSSVNPTVIDPVLEDYRSRIPAFDVSFGVHYQTRYIKSGFALNKIASSWVKSGSDLFSNYFSTYLQGSIPVRSEKDVFDPYISLRKFSPLYTLWDLGVFYTYAEKIIAGAAVRKGNAINGTLGFYIFEKVMVAYSHELNTSGIRSQLGSTSEFTLRIDFSSYAERKRLLSECITHLPYGKQKGIQERKKVQSFKSKYLKGKGLKRRY